jgi:hypothetical protein
MDATVFYPGITSSFIQLGLPSTVPVVSAANFETPAAFIFINAMTSPFTPGQTVTFVWQRPSTLAECQTFLFSGTSVDVINTPLSTITGTQFIT